MATTSFHSVTNNAYTTLSNTLAIGGSSFTVPTGEGGRFPSSGAFWVTVFGDTVEEGHEIILVGGRTSDSFHTLTRGAQSTSAAQWAAGSKVQLMWTKAAVEEIHTAINTLETAFHVSGDSLGLGAATTPSALAHLKGTNSTGKELLVIEQIDQDEPFVRYEGTTAADTTKSLSTAVIGTFTYAGMIRISINGTDRWIPYYS